jgi:GMP synthase (glutamine-hydrolysing)
MKFLVFQHVEHETPGLILEWAKNTNVDIEIVELWKPYKIPNSDGYNALIIMGGPMGVYEDYASKNDEVKFIKDNIGKLPMISFCLGSQLLAYALGAKVYKNEFDGKIVKEIGYYDVSLTERGKAVPS